MKTLFWAGLTVLVLGILSLVVPLPRNERDSVKLGGLSIGVETRHDEKIPPVVSTILILGGAGMMIAGKRSVQAP